MTTNATSGDALHGPGLTDVRDMVMAHDAFRRALRSSASLVSAVNDGDRKRADVLADHLELMLGLLVHHHEGEDALLWPMLLQRVPEELAPLVHLMQSQHEAVHGMLDEVTALIPPWRVNPTSAARSRLADRVEHLLVLLEEHLHDEEKHLLPVAARTVTQPEWDAVAERNLKSLPSSKAPMVFGLFMEVGDPEIIAQQLAKAPAPIRLLLRLTARPAWRRYQARVFDA